MGRKIRVSGSNHEKFLSIQLVSQQVGRANQGFTRQWSTFPFSWFPSEWEALDFLTNSEVVPVSIQLVSQRVGSVQVEKDNVVTWKVFIQLVSQRVGRRNAGLSEAF